MRTPSCQILVASLLILRPVTTHGQEIQSNEPTSQAVQTAELTGHLSDGTQMEPAPPEIPAVDVQQRNTTVQGNHNITFARIVPLDLPEVIEPKVAAQAADVDSAPTADTQRLNLVIISATVYDSEKTLLRWNSGGEEYIAWSNVDFMHLTGFGSYSVTRTDGTTQEYHLIMAIGKASLKELRASEQTGEFTVPNIPPATAGPGFTITKGNPDNASAIEAIQGLHKLYQDQSAVLKSAFESREQISREQEEALRLNPPSPQNVEIFYWKKKHR